MKESMIQEAITLFEHLGDKALEEINFAMKSWEYTNSVNEYRKVDKLSKLFLERFGKSPEEIYIKKEEHLMLLHFALWLKSYLSSSNKMSWEIWRDSVIFGMSTQEIMDKYHIKNNQIVYKRRKKIYQDIKTALPLYYEQYLDLEEYMKG